MRGSGTLPDSACDLPDSLGDAVLAEERRSRPRRAGGRAPPECPLVTARSATSSGSRPAALGRLGDAREDLVAPRGELVLRTGGPLKTGWTLSLASAPRLASRSAFVFFSRGMCGIAKRRKPFARTDRLGRRAASGAAP